MLTLIDERLGGSRHDLHGLRDGRDFGDQQQRSLRYGRRTRVHQRTALQGRDVCERRLLCRGACVRHGLLRGKRRVLLSGLRHPRRRLSRLVGLRGERILRVRDRRNRRFHQQYDEQRDHELVDRRVHGLDDASDGEMPAAPADMHGPARPCEPDLSRDV